MEILFLLGVPAMLLVLLLNLPTVKVGLWDALRNLPEYIRNMQ